MIEMCKESVKYVLPLLFITLLIGLNNAYYEGIDSPLVKIIDSIYKYVK